MSINRRVVGVRAQFNFSFRTTNTTNSNMPPKKNSTGSGGGNQNPIVLKLLEGNITIESEDLPYLEEFTESLTKGQVKSKFQKVMSRKGLSHDDTVVVAETLATQYTDFVKKSNKYASASASNKKAVNRRSNYIAETARDLLATDSDEEEEPEGDNLREIADDERFEEVSDNADTDEVSEEKTSEETANDEETADAGEESDEDLEVRAGAIGFIPVSIQHSQSENSGKITTKTTLLTATYRKDKEYSNQVIGVGTGTLKFEDELNEDGSIKKYKGGQKTGHSKLDRNMYFYSGALNDGDGGSTDVPLKRGIRLRDSKHYDKMCTDIVVRAFSQQVFTHKDLKSNKTREEARDRIMTWLESEALEGVEQVLLQIYDEAKHAMNSDVSGTQESKRKIQEKSEKLKSLSKKAKTSE